VGARRSQAEPQRGRSGCPYCCRHRVVLLVTPGSTAPRGKTFTPDFWPRSSQYSAARDLYNGECRGPRHGWVSRSVRDVAGPTSLASGSLRQSQVAGPAGIGLAMVVVGAAWVVIISLRGSHLGSSLTTGYGYWWTIEAGTEGDHIAILGGLARPPKRGAYTSCTTLGISLLKT